MKMRMLLLLGFVGLSLVPSVAMADGELTLKDTDLSGAQCSLMKKDTQSQSQSQQQTSSTDTSHTASSAEGR